MIVTITPIPVTEEMIEEMKTKAEFIDLFGDKILVLCNTEVIDEIQLPLPPNG
jgi:hypothetical protein